MIEFLRIKQIFVRRGRSNHDVIVESVVGLAAGILIGSIFKSVGRIAISTVGGGFVTISTLAQLGYIRIDWRKAEDGYIHILPIYDRPIKYFWAKN